MGSMIGEGDGDGAGAGAGADVVVGATVADGEDWTGRGSVDWDVCDVAATVGGAGTDALLSLMSLLEVDFLSRRCLSVFLSFLFFLCFFFLCDLSRLDRDL